MAAQVVGLEDDRVAAVGEDLALEPLRASDGQFGDGGPVSESAGAALDRPAGDLRRVEHTRHARIAEAARLEALAALERLVEQLRVAHPVETEAALAVARPIPRVDAPVRKLAFE